MSCNPSLVYKVTRNLIRYGDAQLNEGSSVPRPKTIADGLTKAQRYRKAQHHKGMKLLRVWVSDPRRPEFAREAARQGKLLHGRPEEAEALTFIDAAFSWPEP